MEPINTRRAKGPVLAFWQALPAGDSCAILCLLKDSESGVGPNSVFDTSDLDEWKNYRSNSRWLSAPKASSRLGDGLGWTRVATSPKSGPRLRRGSGRRRCGPARSAPSFRGWGEPAMACLRSSPG